MYSRPSTWEEKKEEGLSLTMEMEMGPYFIAEGMSVLQNIATQSHYSSQHHVPLCQQLINIALPLPNSTYYWEHFTLSHMFYVKYNV